MSYNKKLIVTIIAIACTDAMIYSAFRRTSASLSHIIEPLRPVIHGHLQKIYDLSAMQQMRQHASHARYAMVKMYAPFQHPLYTSFVEPIYVGHKSPVWARQMHDQLNYMMMDAHDRFAKFKYIKWKKTLTLDQESEHHEQIYAYEKAYYNYKRNPRDPVTHEELLHQTQHIHETMIHTRAPLTERILDTMRR